MSHFKTSPLVSCELLHAQLNASNLKILDVRGGWGSDTDSAQTSYAESHIPGASFVDWRCDFLETGLPIELASIAPFVEAKAAFTWLGINRDDTIVLYDDYHHMQAGRIWWAMSYWGFPKVKILNGGWNRWNALGFGISNTIPDIALGDFEPEAQRDHRISLESVDARLEELHLIDARGPAGFAGKKEDPRSGHIPSAVNIPYSLMLDSDTGLFKSETALHEVFLERYPSLFDGEIVSSCGSGYAGTVLLLGLAQIGIQAPLFDGSFAAWKQDGTRPVEQSHSQ